MPNYIQPDCSELALSAKVIVCASFDAVDHTENWSIDDEEII